MSKDKEIKTPPHPFAEAMRYLGAVRQVGVIVHGGGLNHENAIEDAMLDGYAVAHFPTHTRLYVATGTA